MRAFKLDEYTPKPPHLYKNISPLFIFSQSKWLIFSDINILVKEKYLKSCIVVGMNEAYFLLVLKCFYITG